MRDINSYFLDRKEVITLHFEGLLISGQLINQQGRILANQKSDKGLDHLLLLLAAEIMKDGELKEEAKKYQYALPVTADYNSRVEYQLTGCYMQIFSFEGKFAAMIKGPHTPKDGPIGLYCRTGGYKDTINDALVYAVNSKKYVLMKIDPATHQDLLLL